MMRYACPLILAAVMSPALALADGAVAAKPDGINVTEVLKSAADVLGKPVTLPSNDTGFLSARLTIEPGAETGWHQHEAPLYVYVISGEVTVDYGSEGTKSYKAGEAILEALDAPHNGTNAGDEPVELIVVYITGDDRALSTTVPAPSE